jgi:Arc/MetJ-type ribon-helix-helix transcriptional regulator
VLTVRLPPSLREDLETLAWARGPSASISQVVREAIEQFIETSRSDPHWKELIAQRLEAEQAVMDRLRSWM